MVDAVVSILVEKLLEVILNEGHKVLEFHEQFKKMKKELPHLGGFLKDTERVRIKDQKEALKLMAGEIRDLLYEAEDITKDCELYLGNQERRRAYKCIRYFSLSFLKYRCQVGKRLSQINQDIGDCKERMKTYLPSAPSRSSNEEHVLVNNRRERYPILMKDAEIVGLRDDVNKIKGWIMEADDSLTLKVIGIVGMGGIGKTTLAQKIQNNDAIKGCFKPDLIVTISQLFIYEELIKNMLIQLNVNKELLITNDVRILLTELSQQLDGKRYMVILDDVWELGEWWESLKSALPQSIKGCCVMVTTRKDEVARSMGAAENRIHRPQILSKEESWSLFAKIAFAREGGECPSLEIECVGKDIAGKCGGLPLVIKVVAGVMLGKRHSLHEWRRISEHLKEELAIHGQDEKIFVQLQLSYEELPTALKPCMLCFAAFPEDQLISMSNMIYWWIGEGFVREKLGRTAFELGEEYFNELISRGLLLGINKDLDEKSFYNCRVHDMIREMIIRIAREENFMGLDSRGMLCCANRSRRVGLFTRTNMDKLRETNSQVLRTIMGKEIKESEEFALNVRTLFCQLKWLRVLYISFEYKDIDKRVTSKVKWWSGIGSLRHLVCLRIENSCLDRLPDSIGNLQNLQVLFIYNCPNLTSLPTQVTSLVKLTRLEILRCDFIKYLPKGIGMLSNLESLIWFDPANRYVEDGCRLSNLKMLTQLRNLSLRLTSEGQLDGGELKVLVELKQLETLHIGFGRVGNEMVRNVDHDLPPLQKLRELRIYFYPGQRTPAWLNPITLPNLQILEIHAGNITGMSTEFFGNNDKFWDLEMLFLLDLKELKEDLLRMKMAMPSLRKLELKLCPKIKSHPFDRGIESIWRKEEDGRVSH